MTPPSGSELSQGKALLVLRPKCGFLLRLLLVFVCLRQAYKHVAQAGLELLGSRDPPTPDSLEPGATAMTP